MPEFPFAGRPRLDLSSATRCFKLESLAGVSIFRSRHRTGHQWRLSFSVVARKLAAAPMMLFAVQVEHALDVTVQRPHDPDARKHAGAAERGDQDQRFHCHLPLRSLVLILGQFRDVSAGVLESDKRAAAGERNRIIEAPAPSFFGLQ